MAKDRFYRTKPHVNGAVIFGLAQLGFSALGARQIEQGQAITDPRDRGLVAEILGGGVRDSASRTNIQYYTIGPAPDGAGRSDPDMVILAMTYRHSVVLSTIPYLDAAAMIQLKQLGFSAAGTHQIATGQIVTDPQDRGLVAEMLHELILQLAPPMKIGWMRAYCEGTDLRKS